LEDGNPLPPKGYLVENNSYTHEVSGVIFLILCNEPVIVCIYWQLCKLCHTEGGIWKIIV